ncbi:MAG TPA: hypothetical protein VE569_11475, partial [Acidimicrobiia bacterium]|nr:hypothetical protein [Acidimicrobiia bacterium]
GTLGVTTLGALVVSRGSARLAGWQLVVSGLLWSVGLAAYTLVWLTAQGVTTGAGVLVAAGDISYIMSLFGLSMLFLVLPTAVSSPRDGVPWCGWGQPSFSSSLPSRFTSTEQAGSGPPEEAPSGQGEAIMASWVRPTTSHRPGRDVEIVSSISASSWDTLNVCWVTSPRCWP